MIQPIRTKDGRILARKREREITELTVKSTTFSRKTVLELLSHVSTKEMQVLKKKDENSNKSVVIFFGCLRAKYIKMSAHVLFSIDSRMEAFKTGSIKEDISHKSA